MIGAKHQWTPLGCERCPLHMHPLHPLHPFTPSPLGSQLCQCFCHSRWSFWLCPQCDPSPAQRDGGSCVQRPAWRVRSPPVASPCAHRR